MAAIFGVPVLGAETSGTADGLGTADSWGSGYQVESSGMKRFGVGVTGEASV